MFNIGKQAAAQIKDQKHYSDPSDGSQVNGGGKSVCDQIRDPAELVRSDEGQDCSGDGQNHYAAIMGIRIFPE